LKFTIIVVGKSKFAFVEEGVAHYRKQISHFASLDYVELKDSLNKAKESESIQEAIEKRKVGPQKVYLLDEKGKTYTSLAWAQYLGALKERGIQNFIFVIGGAYGHTDALREQYELLSLSSFTFPHDLARVIFLEQAYRALHILSGGKYHHEG